MNFVTIDEQTVLKMIKCQLFSCLQGYQGIRQWEINYYTSPMMINKTTGEGTLNYTGLQVPKIYKHVLTFNSLKTMGTFL